MHVRVHRRTFLRWTAAAAACAPWLAACDPEAFEAGFAERAEAPERFPAGVQAGSMRADGAILWTLSATAAPLTLRLWPLAAPVDAPPAVEVSVDPAEGGFVHVPLRGLPAGEWWRYAFYDDADDVRSAYGQFRTAFAPGVRAPLRVGGTACTAFGRRPFPALSQMAGAELDVFCHLGDFAYNDDAYTLADYRAAWASQLAVPDYRRLLSAVGTYQTWDDHEIVDNAELYDAAQIDRVRVGKQAYFENMPIPRRHEPGSGAVGSDEVFWGSYRWGDTAEFFVLDSRLERRPDTRQTEGQYLGPKQFEWLQQALVDSPCHFKILLNSVPIAQLPPVWAGEPDRWAGYPAQREALLDHAVAHGVRNLWFLSGDFHLGAAWRVEASGPRSAYWEVLCGPGGANRSRRMEIAQSSPQAHGVFFPEGRIAHANDGWASTVLTFDPEADAVRVQFADHETGATLYDAQLRGVEA